MELSGRGAHETWLHIPRAREPRGDRRGRQLRPCLSGLEDRVVLALTFPGIAGTTFGTSDLFYVSYDSTTEFSAQQQSVAQLELVDTASGIASRLVNSDVFSTTGASADPGALTAVGSTPALPSITANEILELQPNGQLFVFDPSSGASSQYDDLPNYTLNATSVYDVQTAQQTNLTGQISLTGATFGGFGIDGNSLVVAAESNDWDFVFRLTYGSSGTVATALVASPIIDGHSTTPEGVAVNPQGTVLTTMPYVSAGSSTEGDVAVGFSLFYDTGESPAPYVPTLGLTSVPDIAAGGIALDSENNFILATTNSSLYGGGGGVVHINSALTAFLADPVSYSAEMPSAITCQTDSGSSYLVFTDANDDQFTDPDADTYTLAGELPLFSGQVSAAQLRNAYGINQISFTGPGGTTVTGDGTGQTIAIVEEGVDPTLAADLTTFDQYFGIPAPPTSRLSTRMA